MTFAAISLQDILEYDDKPRSFEQINYIFEQAYEKYSNFTNKAQDFFEIPKNWFIGETKKELQW